jgi:hypothetical protein
MIWRINPALTAPGGRGSERLGVGRWSAFAKNADALGQSGLSPFFAIWTVG